MSNPAGKNRLGALPLGLLGMLPLVAVVESGVARQKTDLVMTGATDWSLAARAAGREAKGARLVCFGDSLVKTGVVPQILEARTGREAFNLAVGGGQAPGAYYLLRRFLEEGGHPDAVIVEFFPKLLEHPLSHNLQNWPDLLSFAECLDLGWKARDADLAGAILLGDLLPSARARHGLRSAVLLDLVGKPHKSRLASMILVRNWLLNRGAVLTRRDEDAAYSVPGWYKFFFELKRLDPVNVAYLRRFLGLAASRDIPVIWVLPPYTPPLQAECERTGFDRAHTRLLGRLQREYPNLVVLDARRSGYAADAHSDPHHLDSRGAYVFSSDLGDVLRRHLREDWSGPRWIDMPRYVAPASPPDLEDVEDSRLALIQQHGARR